MGLFDKIREPIVLKEGNSLKKQLEELEQLHCNADGELKEKIKKDIYAVKAGMAGEEQIMYELKNSHMPMYIIHDWTITHGDQKAQIDFLVVTRGKAFIIECKNLGATLQSIIMDSLFVRLITVNTMRRKQCTHR